MTNINKLKGKIVERELTIEKLANIMGVDRSTLYRKFNENGESFTIKEANAIADILKLDMNEVNNIFFSQFVA